MSTRPRPVGFVLEGGRTVAEVARNIGVHEMTLGEMGEEGVDAE
jgi:transposase